ncbi:MAG: DUF2244 domain-containing protein [Candidatus Azotimanducaceae bacterium]|jgi:uncharacterized membrane protein
MVELDICDETHTGRIVLRPNYSWTWRYNLYLLYTLTAVSAAVGIGFLLAGAWIILPFSVVELSALAVCMFYCTKQCNRQEVITVTEHSVKIEQGIKRAETAQVYQRNWAKYLVTPATHPWGGARVAIRSHNHESELGGFLSHGDKQVLIQALKRVTPE